MPLPILYGTVLTFYAANFTRDLELPANLLTACHDVLYYMFTVRQPAASGKGFFQNHPRRKISGWVEWKITASAAEEFIDELPDSGDSDTSASPSESEFKDAGDDPATIAVFDQLKN